MKSKTNTISQSTTQLFLDLYDITNDFIILGDGAVSVVITVSAMNFGLLSDNEQDATIYAYAALLNSLSFPIQIVVRSQPKDVTGYLKRIQDQEEKTTNATYRQKIKEYRAFVESLVQDQNVLDKKFYIVIPLSAVEMGLTTQSVIPGAKSKPLSSFEKNYIIEKAKTNLTPRKDHLIDQLARIGLYSRQLNTQELIQMLYSSYNPESFEGLKVTDTSNYTTPLVQAKIQGDFMADMTMTPPQTPGMPTTTPPIAPAPTMTPPTASPAPMSTEPSMGVTPPSMPSTPPSSSSMSEPATAMPEATKTDLGFSTPPQMSNTTPMGMPEPVSAPSPVFSSSTPSTPATSGLTETPSVSVPSSPAMPSTMPDTHTDVADPQSMINQTVSQMGATPTPMPATPTMGSTPSMPGTTMPGAAMPGMPSTPAGTMTNENG
jgi:hypothetical protein